MSLGAHMKAEICEQPRALADAFPRLEMAADQHLARCRPELIVFAARGSSDNAALYGRYVMETQLGLPVVLAAPSVLTRYGVAVRYPKSLFIGISQSGSAPDVADVLARARLDGHSTLAITNRPGSKVAEAAECVLSLEVGEERSVAATKTVTASMLAIYACVNALGGSLPPPLLPTKDWIEECDRQAQLDTPRLIGASRWFALARGYEFATALETSLKLMECALLPCKGYSLADFQHGPRALSGPGTAVVTFGSSHSGLEGLGCEVIEAPSVPDGPDAPLRSLVYGQWLGWHAAKHRGLDPDRPPHITKVTETH